MKRLGSEVVRKLSKQHRILTRTQNVYSHIFCVHQEMLC